MNPKTESLRTHRRRLWLLLHLIRNEPIDFEGNTTPHEIWKKWACSNKLGITQLMAGGGVALIGTTLVPLLSGLFG